MPNAEAWFGFARAIARKYAAPGIEKEDLEQEAFLAVLEEYPKYSPEVGVSKKTFLSRGIRNRLSALKRKTLNLVQVDQYWEARHISGDPTKHLRSRLKGPCDELRKRNPKEYRVKFVKVLEPIGPSLDSGDFYRDQGAILKAIAVDPPQDAILKQKQKVEDFLDEVISWPEIRRIAVAKANGMSFSQMSKTMGRSPAALRSVWSRFQRLQEIRGAT